MSMHVYQQPVANGQPMPFGNQTPGNQNASYEKKNQKGGSPSGKNQRYEKKDKNNSL
jgi:hypothetical protein